MSASVTSQQIVENNLVPIKEAVKHVSYSKDYVTRLAREQKIKVAWMGRQWFVNVDSLRAYEQNAQLEQEIRKRKLSEERKQERTLRSLHKQHSELEHNMLRSGAQRALVTMSMIVMSGAILGVGIHTLSPSSVQVASAVIGVDSVGGVDANNQGQSAEVVQMPVGQLMPVKFADKTVSPLAQNAPGFLLLPDTGLAQQEQIDPAVLFSDPVEVRTLDNGLQVVVVGVGDAQRSVPLVTVPLHEMTVTKEDL